MGKHLHFDCFSGISGDMILGSLIDAGLPLKDLAGALKQVPVKGYRLTAGKVLRSHLAATKADVLVRKGFTSPLSLTSIRQIVKASQVPGSVRERGLEVFEHLAKAEGLAHRKKPTNVRFHEIGVVDSLVDVMGALLGLHLLGVNRISASSVNLGSGYVKTAHGILPVPGPAVAYLAKGVPVHGTGPPQELTTPTGMALLKVLTEDFGTLPSLCPDSIGYGAGSSNPERWPNVLRVYVADRVERSEVTEEFVTQLETNIDDLQPQVYEQVVEELFAGGALDVTLIPVIMKRGRPGIILQVLSVQKKIAQLADIIFRHTTSLGVRSQNMMRRILPRHVEKLRLSGGVVHMKVAHVRGEYYKAAPEFRDCQRIAQRLGRPVREIMEEAQRVYDRSVVRNHAAKSKSSKG